MEQIQEQPKESTAEDVGTRYQHLLDYRDSLEMCIELLKERSANTLVKQQRIGKLMISLEIINATLDAYSGYKNNGTEFNLYKLINSVPNTKEDLKAIGGIPNE